MKRWFFRGIVILTVLIILFLWSNPSLKKADSCLNSCVKKGYKTGECMKMLVTPEPCESKDYHTDESYGQYCEQPKNGLIDVANICCCINE